MVVMSIKLVSINIEGQKHLENVRELLERENPEVICFQECFPETIEDMTNDKARTSRCLFLNILSLLGKLV